MRIVFAIAAVMFTLAACGGGGGKAALQLSATGPANATQDYSSSGKERTSYAPYESGSHSHVWRLSDDTVEIHIGGELEPYGTPLRHVATSRGINIHMGAVRDGVGVNRLKNYEADLKTQDGKDPYEFDQDGFYPFRVAPKLYLNSYFLEDQNKEILNAIFDSMDILNDALPPEFQIELAGVRESNDETITAYSGEIVAILDSPQGVENNCGATAVACAENTFSGDYTSLSFVRIPDDFDTSDYSYSRSTIVHELLHALGIWGHVDSVEFPDSLMGKSGEYIPNLGHVISKIDREALQIMYMSQRSDIYNDWGEWSDTSHHMVGRTEDETLNFGVALFNGLPQPWFRGTRPQTALADSQSLKGTATWEGWLLAYSGPSPLAGGVELEVNMASLANPDSQQDLRFRDIFFLNRYQSEGTDRWFDTRNIDYKINISGNGFLNVREDGYEQGFVTGAFAGAEHEHMGGTLKRTDMVGAFGGSR